MPLDGFKEGFQLIVTEDLRFGIVALGNGRAVCRIFCDQPFLDRCIKCFVKHHVYTSDHAVSKCFSMDRVRSDTPFLLDFIIEFLHIGRGQRRDLLAPDEGLDLIFYHGAVGVQRTLADGEYHILVQPFIHPLAQRHAAFLGEVNVTVEVDELMELFQRAFLCLCECRLVHGRAVILVTDDDAGFPSPIRAFSYCAVALRSSFCHYKSLPFCEFLCIPNISHVRDNIQRFFE